MDCDHYAKIITDMVAEFHQELHAENITAAAIIQRIEKYLPDLQSIGTTVFRRWAKLINPS